MIAYALGAAVRRPARRRPAALGGNAYGAWPDEPPAGMGIAEAPAATAQPDLDWARGLADAVLARAASAGRRLRLRRGPSRRGVQHDAMDDAPTGGAYVAEAVAAAAALFHAPSGDVAERLAASAHVLPVPASSLSGGAARASRRPGRRRPRRRRSRAVRCAELAAAAWRTRVTTRVCVVGCGAIGSLYAAHLARLDDVEVWAVDPWRRARRRDQRARPAGDRAASQRVHRARARDHGPAADVPPCDFGIVATKAEHTRAAVAACARRLRRRGRGQRAERAGQRGGPRRAGAAGDPRARSCRRARSPSRAWCATTRPVTPGSDPSSRGPRRWARWWPLSDLLTRAGLPCHALVDARGPQWDKVIFNSATSPLAALTGLPMGPLCSDPALRVEIDALVAEAQAVCAALGIETAKDPDAAGRGGDRGRLRPQAEHAAGRARAAAHRGRRPQRRHRRAGPAAGVPTPRHDAMVALVHGLERSWEETA